MFEFPGDLELELTLGTKDVRLRERTTAEAGCSLLVSLYCGPVFKFGKTAPGKFKFICVTFLYVGRLSVETKQPTLFSPGVLQ